MSKFILLLLISLSSFAAGTHKLVPAENCDSQKTYKLKQFKGYVVLIKGSKQIEFNFDQWTEMYEHYPYTTYESDAGETLRFDSYDYSSHIVDKVVYNECYYDVISNGYELKLKM